MTINKYNPKHKATVESWFKEYKWSPIDWTTLPKNAFVAKQGKNILAFNYFFLTEVKTVAIMGVTIANPAVSKELRDEALDNITAHLLQQVEKTGVEYFFYFADKNPMVERMQKHGMLLTDPGNAYILMKAFHGKNLEYFDE